MGKILIVVGVVLILIGLFYTYGPKIQFPGKLPGDIVIEKENFRLYIPIMTSILVSILLSLVLFLMTRWRN